MKWLFRKREDKPENTPAPLPVPSYVSKYFVPDLKKCDAENLSGSIRCTCGCTAFKAMHSVDDDRLFHLLCRDCGEDILLFDGAKHGWDALVCQMPMEDMQGGEAAEQCERCSFEHFQAEVWYEPTNREDYENCRGELSEEEWVNAFTWFSADLRCTGCGHRVRGWADIETA